MNIVDAHMHLDMHDSHPFMYLQNLFKEKKICGGVLILNTMNEKKYFRNHFQRFQNYGNIIHVAAAMDIHNLVASLDFFHYLQLNHIAYSIKIHPRMHHITKRDFNKIAIAIKELSFRAIIIDSFYYGSDLDTHIMLEMGIYLAKKCPNTYIIFAHYGGCKILEMMLYTRELKNVYYDVSFTQNYLKGTSVFTDIAHVIKVSSERVMFGSDSPSFSFESAYRVSQEMFKCWEVNCEVIEQFYYGTAKKVFGLEC